MIFAGVDAGGTKVRVAACDERGRLVAHREGPGANALTDGPDAASARIAAVLAGLKAEAVAVGLAGAWSPRIAALVTARLRAALSARRVLVRNDAVAILEGLSPRENAVLVAAGTGTVTIGRSASGRIVRVDGWGPVFGDAGSGVWIARLAIERALRAHDGRDRPSAFGRAILRAAGLTDPGRDIRRLYAPGFRPQALARLVPLIAARARRGDREARSILRGAGAAMTESALAALRRLPPGSVRVFLTGGLSAIPEIRAALRRVGTLDPRAVVPEAAALRLAIRSRGGPSLEHACEPVIRRLDRSRPTRVREEATDVPATELANPLTAGFSGLPPLGMVRAMNREDSRVAPAIERILPKVARVVALVEGRLRRGGRLIYVGAGTSGRLGVLDASEVPPTFGMPRGVVVGVIAGGRRALDSSVEGAEDDYRAGARAVRELRVGRKDAVIGLSVSGSAPYVVEALREARRRGAAVAAITCNRASQLARTAGLALVPEVGPEVVAGSSRLKAGTAQKMLLNIISTCAFARLGRVRGNLMSHVTPTNAKLRGRAIRVAARVLGIRPAEAKARLTEGGWRLDRVLGNR